MALLVSPAWQGWICRAAAMGGRTNWGVLPPLPDQQLGKCEKQPGSHLWRCPGQGKSKAFKEKRQGDSRYLRRVLLVWLREKPEDGK